MQGAVLPAHQPLTFGYSVSQARNSPIIKPVEDPVRIRTVLIPLSLAAFAACADQPAEVAGPMETPAPLLAAAGAGQAPDRYIVVFKNDVADPAGLADELIRANGGTRHFTYQYAIKGFAATLPAPALEGIRRNPNVDYVEADGEATVIGSPEVLSSSQWGLDRIDQRDLTRDYRYYYNNEGAGVEAYILDTGIRYTHQEFGGRAVSGHDYVDNDDLSQDCHGHGTHVAGTVGGSTVGVAKSVTLIGVRVLNCQGSGSYSGIISAVDGVTQQKLARPNVPMVGNMSLGGGVSTSLNSAVNNSVDKGVVWAVAAGNDNADACTKSPASAAKALTTGASTSSDARASFSNFGSCVDLFAPGASIYSSTYNGDNTYASWNGTSMASPHVAGVAALYLAANPSSKAADAAAAIVTGTTRDKLSGVNGSPNYLLYSLVAGGSGQLPPAAPTASITASPTSITQGESATLQWSSTNATSCTVSTGGSGLNGTQVVSPTTTTAYSVNCTGDGGSASDQVTVSVTIPSTGSVHAGPISATALLGRKNWKASAAFSAHDANHGGVAGATVSFRFAGGANGTSSCVTGSDGACSYTTGAIKNNASVTFEVTGISAPGMTYDPSPIHGGSVIVNR